jgi:hypothetical protein
MKEAINVSNFDVESYLDLDKRSCNASLYNNNRIAFGITQYCGLMIRSGFESPCDSSADGNSPDEAFFPLTVGVPSFVQFHNRTLGMSSPSPHGPTMVVSARVGSDSVATTSPTDGNKWLLSYNGILNGKETASLNDGKVAIEIPTENKIVMVPVDKKANALSFLIPPFVNSIKDIENKRAELCAVHATEEELRAFNRSIKTVKMGSLSEPTKIDDNEQRPQRPQTLKIYDLYDVS